MTEIATSLDGLLNRRVILEQPLSGYRVAMDTVFLAAAIPAKAGDKVLDLGCGVGGAILCLSCRVPGILGLGIEIQQDLTDLCRNNIAHNAYAKGIEVRQGDVTQLPDCYHKLFDHVMMNPPYHDEDSHDVSANEIKRAANSGKEGDLALWIASAVLALKPSGTVTLIHRADRRDEILACLKNSFGHTEILPLAPKQGADPKRILVRAIHARKQAQFSIKEHAPFILHKEKGGYSDEAEKILRYGGAL